MIPPIVMLAALTATRFFDRIARLHRVRNFAGLASALYYTEGFHRICWE
jgi:hypothetical protein